MCVFVNADAFMIIIIVWCIYKYIEKKKGQCVGRDKKGQLRDTIEHKIGKNTTVHITYVCIIYISEEIDFLKEIIH